MGSNLGLCLFGFSICSRLDLKYWRNRKATLICFSFQVDHIRQLKAQQTTCCSRVTQLEADVKSGKQKSMDLEAKLVHLDHFETGQAAAKLGRAHSLNCKDVRQNFQRPYDKPPKIVIGTIYMDVYNDANLRHDVQVMNVDTKGFTLRFCEWADTYIVQMNVDWISIPA